MNVYTYNMEYCNICNLRACRSQNTIFNRFKDKCSNAIPPNKYCTLIGCCHGCQCSLWSYCPYPRCNCDCHEDVLTILNNC